MESKEGAGDQDLLENKDAASGKSLTENAGLLGKAGMAENNGDGKIGAPSSPTILDVPEEHLTPGMKQYRDIKRQHPDCLVILRMGDFYEMFYQDAVTAARELEIALTARGQGEKRAPLAGVPYHALESYLAKLIRKGYKVAIVEQLEDPRQAKGLVRRGVVRIVTPGTVIESSLLSEGENNYLLSLTKNGSTAVYACCDVSTGEFFTAQVPEQLLMHEIARLRPSECLIPASMQVDTALTGSLREQGIHLTVLEDYFFRREQGEEILRSGNLRFAGVEGPHLAVAGSLYRYLLDTQKNSLSHLRTVSLRNNQFTMLLDAATLRNLEIMQNVRGEAKGLLSVLDSTVTSMGSRLLKKWIKEPLLQREEIEQRLDAVEELKQQLILREELKTLLRQVLDIERLTARANYGTASPKDLLALKQSLQPVPQIKERLKSYLAEMAYLAEKSSTSNRQKYRLLEGLAEMPGLENVGGHLHTALLEDAPLTVREGGIIKPGYNAELDELLALAQGSRQHIQKLEEQERTRTGISTLKIGYTRVFGYFIEVTRRNLQLVPPHYIRKQTTSNSERYVTEELKQLEERILHAQERMQQLEYELFQGLMSFITAHTAALQESASKLAVLDVLCSLAECAQRNRYCRPQISERSLIRLRRSRHPVIEHMQPTFVANDLELEPGEMMVITGPNMSGKSSFMRQVALTVLMAQFGSFVPAEEAVLGIVDRVFTRIGAQDDLTSGQSTFMVEMGETAAIMQNATERSLIILDEIGRGTSTFDGVAIAWSVAEHIHNNIRARTLFSTHYHVMNKIAERCPRVKNYNLAVQELRGDITFLYSLREGGTDQSYGIHVAELAGLPLGVVERAREIQGILEQDDEMVRKLKARKLEGQKGLGEF